MGTAKCGDNAPVVAMMLCVLGDMAIKVSPKVGVETGWLTKGRNSEIVRGITAVGDSSQGCFCFSRRCNQPSWRNGCSSRGWCRTGTCLSGRGIRGGSGSSRAGLTATWRCCCVATTCWSLNCLARGCRQAGVAVSKDDEQPVFEVAEDVKRLRWGSP